ncbi:NADP-binding protein [Dacryopinax primogenitus]|uniref:NADP-binding protein n=1 Tax=Dacryopinax primogenitus (strain DJM 731) TaxID=1858805 RepID=M5G031_DACPD|nr:NADP-binding protein [Dacryopinax primogenitus]EJU01510.1 NADP-binding protein [Dacryopinax primogenitus]
MVTSLLGKARSFFNCKPISRPKAKTNNDKSTTMKALIVQPDKIVAVERVFTPTIGPNDILFRVIEIGQNPTDWKHAAYISQPGDLIGCDFVGQVVSMGTNVPKSEVQPGELRWGFVRGGVSKGVGAFAEYIATEWDLTSTVAGITPAQAASLPIPLVTAIQALYLHLKLPDPFPQPSKEVKDKWILIWSGATSVGQFAIQLAKLTGLKVATTASPRRFDMLKAWGADVTLDYHDPDVVGKLKEKTCDAIEFGLDCISENETYKLAQQAFRPSGGHLVCLLVPKGDLPRPEVKTEWMLAYTALGKDVQMGENLVKSSPVHRALHVKWAKRIPGLLKNGTIKPLEVHEIGGLEDVQKGFEMMKNGQHPGKLVYKVADVQSMLDILRVL